MTTAETYGPHTEQVVALLEMIAAMTVEEASCISALPSGQFVRMATEKRIAAYKRSDLDRVLERANGWAAAIKTARSAVQEAAGRDPVDENNWEAVQKHADTWDPVYTAATNAAVAVALRDILDLGDFEALTAPLGNALGVTL